MDFIHKPNHRAKNLTIKISANGEVIVVSPASLSLKKVTAFVDSKADWIKAQLAKIKKFSTGISDDNQIIIFGKKYSLSYQQDLTKHHGVWVEKDQLIINQYTISNSGKKQLDRFLKGTLTKYLVPRTHQLAEKMGLSFNQIKIKEQSTRWGSCSSNKNLNFNWQLIYHPTPVIDYVIIHELSHLVHMNHSAAFWNLVKKYDPEYMKHRGHLKRFRLK